MRETIITPDQLRAVYTDIEFIRDEWRQISLTGLHAASLWLTISSTAGGSPIIEIPGAGQFVVAPEAVQALAEGGSYFYNIWQQAAVGRDVVASGRITVAPSITPTGTDYPTTFLSGFGQVGGPSQVVALTRAAYAALPVKDPATIYMITD